MAEEKALRQRFEASVQDKDREISMMSVDLRQLQYKIEKTDSELRQENEKNRGLVGVSERLKEEKSLMQSELSVQASENTLMKTNEKRLLRDLAEYRERNKSLEEELHKVKAARSVDDLQRFVKFFHLQFWKKLNTVLVTPVLTKPILRSKVPIFRRL